jgi:hypothetical protein
MVDGACRIAARFAKLAFLIALGDDGFTGEFAALELGPLCVLFDDGFSERISVYLLRGSVVLPSFCWPYAVLI